MFKSFFLRRFQCETTQVGPGKLIHHVCAHTCFECKLTRSSDFLFNLAFVSVSGEISTPASVLKLDLAPLSVFLGKLSAAAAAVSVNVDDDGGAGSTAY